MKSGEMLKFRWRRELMELPSAKKASIKDSIKPVGQLKVQLIL